jgi:hypothetical protein
MQAQAVGDEGALEARADLVVEQVVDHAVAEAGRPHLARLREGDDEEDRRPGLRAADQVEVELSRFSSSARSKRSALVVLRLCWRQSKYASTSSSKEKGASLPYADRAGVIPVADVVPVLVAVAEVLHPGVVGVVGVLRSIVLSTSPPRSLKERLRQTRPGEPGGIRKSHGGGLVSQRHDQMKSARTWWP